MKNWFWAVLTTTMLLVPTVALAHAGGEHIMGVVKTVQPPSLVVETQDGKQVTVHLDDQTKYEKSGAPSSVGELKAGERVVVHAMKHGEMLHVTLVKWGKQAEKKDGAAPQPQKPDAPKAGEAPEPGHHAH